MNEISYLQDRFEYEQWALEKWVAPARTVDGTDILLHVVGAHEVWLARCQGRPWEEDLEEHLENRIVRTCAGWKNYLANADLDEEISYTNREGLPFTNVLRNIVTHVLNHGTYHRGELRGLHRAEGSTDFPETDFIVFCREKRALGARA